MILRDYQRLAVEDIYAEYRAGRRRVLLALPTGGGKTAIIAALVARTQRRVLVLVHRRELLDQCSRALTSSGVAHSVLAAGGRVDVDALVIVASVQTYATRTRSGWVPERIVIDEGHHATAGTWRAILAAHPEALVLGVTATPVRMSGAGLGDVYDALVVGPSVAELTAAGWLSPVVAYSLPVVADLARLRSHAGDYAHADVVAAVDVPGVTGDAVAHYSRLCAGTPAIAFCASVAHAAHVAEAMRAAGYASESVDGTLDADTRRDRIEALGDGRIQVLTSCEIISEGTDVPIVTAAILLRPTQSLGLHLQQVGRVLRPAPSKSHALIVDHVGNVLRHGLPGEARTWSLDAQRRRVTPRDIGPAPPVLCETCYRHTPRPLPAACACGAAFSAEARTMREHAGELIPVDVTDVVAYREAVEEQRRRVARSEEAAARTLPELMALGRARGYAAGWARHRWQARLER